MSSESGKPSKGLFIVLEGIDGSGKTTIAKALIQELEKRGYRTLYTFEPTDSDIVNIIKNKYGSLRDPFIDALAFALDRLIHIKTKIKPALENGFIVLADRYFYSSVAYQSASGAPIEWVFEVNRWAIKPDIAVYLDVDPKIALQRKTGSFTRFPEFEELGFLSKVREIYLTMVKQGLLVKVDAARSIEEVFEDVKHIVLEELRRRSL
ncbi:MAG: dTMP kinase [Desulfurococcaceae archaeon]